MASDKLLVFLGLCALATCLPTEPKAHDDPNLLAEFGGVANVNPRMTVNTEGVPPYFPGPGFKVKLQGWQDTSNQNYYVNITVTDIPIFVPTAVPPQEGQTRIPDNDEIENIQVYFANADGRILEVRFNRFQQYLGRLWARPYKMLRDDVTVDIVGLSVGSDKYAMTVIVPANALPAQTTSAHAVVVDPTREGGDKYYTYYRLYNYPIAFDWNMKVYQKFMPVDLYQLAPESENADYSSWWNGI
ncbi:uncharacterized protein LOC132199936 [Neocloeon triangulifer]|uniref:uncharacterized protein LOC132199936 n=1 Tax=Neocloeon triangulifer TaxID=2078957 RepID=UPI00286EC9E6|nr:uncharacterized protein LOC132199936 [Neocloeon triangulifer]